MSLPETSWKNASNVIVLERLLNVSKSQMLTEGLPSGYFHFLTHRTVTNKYSRENLTTDQAWNISVL